jgi:hypothetical protein
MKCLHRIELGGLHRRVYAGHQADNHRYQKNASRSEDPVTMVDQPAKLAMPRDIAMPSIKPIVPAATAMSVVPRTQILPRDQAVVATSNRRD